MSADLMRIVAIRIVACFSSYKQFATKPEIQSFLHPLIDCIQFFADAEKVNQDNKNDAYLSIVTVVTDIVSHSKSIQLEEHHIHLLSKLMQIMDECIIKIKNITSAHLSNLILLYQRVLLLSTSDSNELLLMNLANQFKEKTGESKFKLLDFFISHLSTSNPNESYSKWLPSLQIAINIMLQNKLSSQQNNKLITLISMLVRFVGAKQFFVIPPTTLPVLKFDKFMALTLHIICAEIRVLVDDYKIPSLTSIHEIDEDDAHILPLSLETLDYMLLYISSDLLDDASEFDCEIMLSIRGTLTEAFLSIAAFLDEIYVKQILNELINF